MTKFLKQLQSSQSLVMSMVSLYLKMTALMMSWQLLLLWWTTKCVYNHEPYCLLLRKDGLCWYSSLSLLWCKEQTTFQSSLFFLWQVFWLGLTLLLPKIISMFCAAQQSAVHVILNDFILLLVLVSMVMLSHP